MSKRYSQRHSPAFVLLFLARGPNYGGAIIKMMKEEIPRFMGDGPMIYRMLQSLEDEGLVTARWETPETGRPLKMYELTDKGWEYLLAAEEEMEKRIANHIFFLEELRKVKNEKYGDS